MNQAAIEIQEWLYGMFLPVGEQKSWYMRDIKGRAEELLKELSTAQTIYVDYDQYELLDSDGNELACRMEYSYNRKPRWLKFDMVYQEGWKITSIVTTGWKWVKDDWYYLDDMGAVKTGWQQIDKTWYYMDENGIMQTGWQQIDGKYYYFREDGAMWKYWLEDGGIWYYFAPNGMLQTGWCEIGGKWYYLDEQTGVMAADARIDGYYVNADGEWIPDK